MGLSLPTGIFPTTAPRVNSIDRTKRAAQHIMVDVKSCQLPSFIGTESYELQTLLYPVSLDSQLYESFVTYLSTDGKPIHGARSQRTVFEVRPVLGFFRLIDFSHYSSMSLFAKDLPHGAGEMVVVCKLYRKGAFIVDEKKGGASKDAILVRRVVAAGIAELSHLEPTFGKGEALVNVPLWNVNDENEFWNSPLRTN